MNILLVDDDNASRPSLADFMRELGHQVMESDNGQQALELYKQYYFHMVLSDIHMPKLSGLDLLRQLTSQPGGCMADIVLFTGYGDVSSAVDALRAGAYDYILKPVDVDELASIIDRIAEHQALRQENKVLSERFAEQLSDATKETQQELVRMKQLFAKVLGVGNVAAHSPQMKKVLQLAQRYSMDRAMPVLIEGETGTGKEVVARLIHFGSMEEYRPFVDINCAALTANLFESELFGYESGAYTGASSKGQKGKFDVATGGTLFLDEVGEIPFELQGKLLRVIQEKEFYRVGGLKKVATDVRIICATNVDLDKKVQQGLFRKDLYYRINVGNIKLQPLRDRIEDILPLAIMFLEDFSREKKKQFVGIHPSAATALRHYSWPGNVRELRNLIDWVTFMYNDSQLTLQHFEDTILNQTLPISEIPASEVQADSIKGFVLPPNGINLGELNAELVKQAMERCSQNKTAAAKLLGISRRALYSRLK